MSKEKSSENLKKDSVKRFRNFTFLIYPDCENTPENWIEVLRDIQLQFFVSPLHDSDFNPTGEKKKSHYHVILMFDSQKTREQAQEVCDLVGGVVPPKIGARDMFIVSSIRSAARYLCHLDNPEKQLYEVTKVTSIGGADYMSIIDMEQDKYTALTEMEDFCEKYNITSFYLLSRYASKHRSDWSRVLKTSGSIYMDRYLKSKRWSAENGEVNIVDPSSGETID